MVILNGWMLDVNRFLWDVPLDVPNLLLAITTDASDVAMGAIIEQRGPHGWEPLAFWSKKLSAALILEQARGPASFSRCGPVRPARI